MKTLVMTNTQARLLASTLGEIVEDDEKKYHLRNGKHPQYRRSVYLSDHHCFHLQEIRHNLETLGVEAA